MTERDVFVLGAGFSKAISRHMPVMRELTEQIFAMLDRFDMRLPPPIKSAASRSELENNIELWMTFLTQSHPWQSTVLNEENRAKVGFIRNFIESVINRSTSYSMERSAGDTGESSPPDWLSTLIHEWHSRQTTVITLNYDTLVERAALWYSTRDGQRPIDPTRLYPPYFSDIRSRSAVVLGSQEGLDTFRYCKLHGSVNWHYSGKEDFHGETIYFSQVSPWGPDINEYESQSLLVNVDKAALIIPPVMEKTTFFNNESVRKLWHDASIALVQATRVIVIGYSLPASDLGMEFFLRQNHPAGVVPWYIVNPDPEVISRFQWLLEPYQSVNTDYVGGTDAIGRLVDDYSNSQL